MEKQISRRIFLGSTAVALGAAAVGTAGAADGHASGGAIAWPAHGVLGRVLARFMADKRE